MDSALFQRVRELFHAACELPTGERAAYLDAAGVDSAVRGEVEALLSADSEGHGLLSPAAGDLGERLIRCTLAGPSPDALPARVGGYRVIARIGAGGMGEVLQAEQDAPRRTVAIKLLRAGAATPFLERRFELEAHVLGRLHHPNIAQIFEAGVETLAAADGRPVRRPYFAMEFVPGLPLTRYAEERRLTVPQRIALLARVCDAVQHAHQRGVIHRDLKPANILVTDDGQPKVLDFGVARTLDDDSAALTREAGLSAALGTLPYMSPEQLRGDRDAVDTRADVYALGVILFQLLCGRLPHDLSGKNLIEAARIVAERTPPRLSAVNRALRGDVELIAARTLATNPAQRYASAAELAADLRACVAGAPISLKRESFIYVLRKWVLRHRLVAALLAGLAALTLGSAVTFAVLYRRADDAARLAKQQRDAATAAESRAQAQTARSERVRRFLTDVLQAADIRALGREATVVEALEYAAARSLEEFSDDPQTRADVLQSLSEAFADLGQRDRAHTFGTQAVAEYRGLGPAATAGLIRALGHLGAVTGNMGRSAEAAPLLEEALDLARRANDSLEVCRLLVNLGSNRRLLKDLPGALQLLHQAEEIADAHPPENAEQFATVATLYAGLAAVHYELNQIDASAAAAARGVELFEQGGESVNHPDYAAALHNLATLENARGNVERARELHYRTLDVVLARRGPEHPDTANAYIGVAQFERLHDNPAPSAEMFEKALLIRRQLFPPGDAEFGYPLSGLAAALLKLERPAEAEPYLREAYEIRMRLAPEELTTGMTAEDFGECLMMLGRLEEAERPLLEGYELMRRYRGPQGTSTLAVGRNVVELYRRLGAADKVAEWEAKVAPPASEPATRPAGP